jgi:hypothetical protein
MLSQVDAASNEPAKSCNRFLSTVRGALNGMQMRLQVLHDLPAKAKSRNGKKSPACRIRTNDPVIPAASHWGLYFYSHMLFQLS